MPREVRRVREMVTRLVDRVGHVDPSAGGSPTTVVISGHLPHVGGCHVDRSNVVLQRLVASAQNTSISVPGASSRYKCSDGRVGFSARSNAGAWHTIQGRMGACTRVPPTKMGSPFQRKCVQEHLLNAAAGQPCGVIGLDSAHAQKNLQACEHGVTEDAHPIPNRWPTETYSFGTLAQSISKIFPEAVRSFAELSSPIQVAFPQLAGDRQRQIREGHVARQIRQACFWPAGRRRHNIQLRVPTTEIPIDGTASRCSVALRESGEV